MGVDPKSMRLTPMSKECYKKIFYVTITCKKNILCNCYM